MPAKNKPNSKNTIVLKFIELTDYFEAEAEKMIVPVVHLSSEDKNEIAQELEATIQNIRFMIKFFSLGEESDYF